MTIVVLYEAWCAFDEEFQAVLPCVKNRPDYFKAMYEKAKNESEKARSLVPAQGLEESTTRPESSKLSVELLIVEHGRYNLDTSSLAVLKTSFNTYYKAVVLRLHPDKSDSDAEKFKILGNHKAWVEALTEAQFAATASAK